MAQNEKAQAMPPGPDPELKLLDRFVGTWKVRGQTLDSKDDDVSGQISFEWLPGGFFLQQRVELNFMGYEIKGLEIIGYDPSTRTFPSTVYSNMVGVPLPYQWEIEGDDVTIRTEFGGGATYRGTWGADGTSMSGGWRPDEGKEGPGNVAYDISGTRVN
jgi:uncharacterized protein DUF1579